MDTQKAADALMQHILDPGLSVSEGIEEDPSSLSHLKWMLRGIINGYVTHDKAHRWIGYVQGVLVARALGTLSQMKKINHEAS